MAATYYKPTTGESAAALILFLPALLWSAFVAAKLWAWFAVPAGLPAFGFAHIIGLRMLAFYFARGVQWQETRATTDDEYTLRSIVWPIFAPAWVLGFAAIVKAFM